MKKHHNLRIGKPYKHLKVESMTFTVLDKETKERVDRISEEFKNGFTIIKGCRKSVTFWGSARILPKDPDYQKASRIAAALAKEGFSIVTGGGPGIMAAANCGAYDAGGKSVGLTIKLPMEQMTNLCLTHHMRFKYFFARKVCLAYAAEAYLFFPGGFGTMDEFFEILTLIQTNKISPAPVLILVGKKYWKNMEKFIEKTLLKNKMVSKEDLNLYKIMDDEKDIIEAVKKAPLRNKD